MTNKHEGGKFFVDLNSHLSLQGSLGCSSVPEELPQGTGCLSVPLLLTLVDLILFEKDNNT